MTASYLTFYPRTTEGPLVRPSVIGPADADEALGTQG
jgi:hypothetical protein